MKLNIIVELIEPLESKLSYSLVACNIYLTSFYFRIKEGLRKAYAEAANDFQQQLDSISAELVNLEGSLQSQLNLVQGLTKSFEPLQESLNIIQMLDHECIEANTEENDYTVYSLEDLSFGLDLVKEAVQKKSAFIQNQVGFLYFIHRKRLTVYLDCFS